MCPLFFAMDHNNYAKYLTIYLVSLLNANHTHPGVEQLLRDDGFSVSRSSVTNSRIAVDQTIEQTINRHAKSHGGIVGFSQNLQAYYRWCVTRHLRGTYLTGAMENAGMISEEESTHKDVRSSKIAKTENNVKKILQSFDNFSNPFETDQKEDLLSFIWKTCTKSCF